MLVILHLIIQLFLEGIGITTTIRYKLQDSLLFVDSVDIYNRKSFQQFTNEIFNHKFLFSKDSLIDLDNHDKYYSQKYFDHKNNSQSNKKFYLIIDDNKKKITKFNVNRIFDNIDTNTQDLIELEKIEAKEKYGINPDIKHTY